jgi:hypothetical protein
MSHANANANANASAIAELLGGHVPEEQAMMVFLAMTMPPVGCKLGRWEDALYGTVVDGRLFGWRMVDGEWWVVDGGCWYAVFVAVAVADATLLSLTLASRKSSGER